jgi:opacity protein-like surface antigen
MKKIIFANLFSFLTICIHAQKIGVRFGSSVGYINNYKQSGAKIVQTDLANGSFFAIPIEYSFNKTFSVVSGVNFVQGGLKLDYVDGTVPTFVIRNKYNLLFNATSIPVMAKAKLSKGMVDIYGATGLDFMKITKAKTETLDYNNETLTSSSELPQGTYSKNWQTGWTAAVGVEIELGKITLSSELRLANSFQTSINDHLISAPMESKKMFYGAASVGVAYRIN